MSWGGGGGCLPQATLSLERFLCCLLGTCSKNREWYPPSVPPGILQTTVSLPSAPWLYACLLSRNRAMTSRIYPSSQTFKTPSFMTCWLQELTKFNPSFLKSIALGKYFSCVFTCVFLSFPGSSLQPQLLLLCSIYNLFLPWTTSPNFLLFFFLMWLLFSL